MPFPVPTSLPRAAARPLVPVGTPRPLPFPFDRPSWPTLDDATTACALIFLLLVIAFLATAFA